MEIIIAFDDDVCSTQTTQERSLKMGGNVEEVAYEANAKRSTIQWLSKTKFVG